MSKWLAKFSGENQEIQPDIPDIVSSVSGLSGPFSTSEGENGPVGPPAPPLQPGWIVTYTDRQGRLCGGWDERASSIVRGCTWDGRAWTVTLSDDHCIPLHAVRAVGQTDAEGHLTAAWTVRGHGYDGQGEPNEGGR